MKEARELCELLKHDMQWERMTLKQKLISVWYILSFVVLGMSGDSVLFTLVAVANFAASVYCMAKYVPMEDE